MDIFFLFLTVPFLLHAIGNVYVDHFAAGHPKSKDPYEEAFDGILELFERNKP